MDKNKKFKTICAILFLGLILGIWKAFTPKKDDYVRFDHYDQKRSPAHKPRPQTQVIRKPSRFDPPSRAGNTSKFSASSKINKHVTRGDKVNEPHIANDIQLSPQSKHSFIRSAEVDYALVDNYFAIENNETNFAQFPQAKSFGSFLFVKSDTAPANSLRVVQNNEGKNLAIVTNILRISFYNEIDWNLINQLPSSDIVLQDENLAKVYLRFDTYEQVKNNHQEIIKYSSVRRATIDILEYIRHQR